MSALKYKVNTTDNVGNVAGNILFAYAKPQRLPNTAKPALTWLRCLFRVRSVFNHKH